MARSARWASLALSVLALSFASCPVEALVLPTARVAPGLSTGARLIREARARADQELPRMAAPRDDSAMRTASAKTGDVLADDSEGDEVEGLDLGPGVDGAKNPPVDDDLALGAIAKETFIYARPSWQSKKIGYLRGGAVVKRSEEPATTRGCEDGWYRIAPEGYVCVGKNATIDVGHPRLTAAARRPDRTAAMPYAYGMSLFPTPPFYTKAPSAKEQRQVELELEHHLKMAPLDKGWSDVSIEPIPELIAGGKQITNWNGVSHSPGSLYTGRALTKSGFAFIDFFESDGRKLGLTVDLEIVPLDRLRRVVPSSFHGIALDENATLPVAFAMQKGAQLWTGEPTQGGLKPVRALGYREAVPITGKRLRVGGVAYLETKSGEWLRDELLVRVEPMKNRPGWATPGRTWIDVSILKQALIAYEGTKPVYVTLVSTGADGLGDPKETHSTVRGQFLIHTKHVTATMSGDELGDEFDLRDVPYVQYFRDGYALHAAYWHDSFGRPRSHGCINLSPLDARWLFHWTDPAVPQGWHSAMSLHEGTLVYVHP